MIDTEELKTKSIEHVERVWQLTYEKNEHGDIHEGAELELDGSLELATPVLKASKRKLYNAHLDKTIPFGDYNYYVITEVREKDGLIGSFKVLACKLPKSESNSSVSEVKSGSNSFYIIAGSAFAAGLLVGWLINSKK